jgi:predicted nucleic acid-binding Zn ribbon protein
LTRVTDQAARANFWNRWLSAHLAPEICTRVSGVVERNGELVIFAESAAWCARLRRRPDDHRCCGPRAATRLSAPVG